jgi:hypothetical protein
MIFAVAVVAVAAAAAGPTYYSAAQTSILRDTLGSAPVVGRGFEVTQSGPVSGTIDGLSSEVSGVIAEGLGPGSAGMRSRMFQPQIEAIESTAFDEAQRQAIPLVWRSDVCSHLAVAGSCPARRGEVIASRSLAAAFGLRIGQRLAVPSWGTLTITGIYTPPAGGDYWFDRTGTYFPAEFPPGGPGARGPVVASVDALFTVRDTLEDAPAGTQGSDVLDELLAPGAVRPGDVKRIDGAVNALINNYQLQSAQAVATSVLPSTVGAVTSAWSSLAVPVLLISAQLLGLAWLLLFLLVTDEAEARGPEVALAKLRGHGRLRTVAFGLSEPVMLLAVALPVGVLAGWGATSLLSHDLLRPGTPVALPPLAWATAAAAVVGGLMAAILASRRMLSRTVVEQWRRTGRHAAERGWVIDAILLTAAAVGLLDLLATGTVSSAHKNALALLVPGLLGLAVAVVASRLLPIACRALTAGSRGVGGLGAYLALRHVARRPGGARTTIMVATAFALATFAIAAWAVNDRNDTVLARAQVGAPYVLYVNTLPGTDLGALVDRADPSGLDAAPVVEYQSSSTVTMAVDPARWAKVATWPESPPEGISKMLDPPAPLPLVLDGSSVRISAAIERLSPPGSTLVLDVDSRGATAPTPVQLGTPPASGRYIATAGLVGCPCVLQDLTLQPPPSAFSSGPSARGTLTLAGIEVQRRPGGEWSPVPAGLADPQRWSAPGTPGLVLAGHGGLTWTFDPRGQGGDAVLAPVDKPLPLPAVAAEAVTAGRTGPDTVAGVDGANLAVDVERVVPAVPGAPANGVLVDLDYARLAADTFVSSQATEQVWVAAAARTRIADRLQRLGVAVSATTSQAGVKSVLGRQGPGLARVLFLAEAGVAAALAAAGAILGLYLSARRRRYEYAALRVTGLRTRTLLGSLVAEQLIVLAFGLAVGIGAGLVAVDVALRAVPEFLTVPAAPRLSYLPPPGELVGLLAAVVAVVLAGALISGAIMIRSVRLDQLREAPA